MKKGLFICFIGIDGSGKSTHAKNLKNYLLYNGKSCNYLWCGWRSFESFFLKPVVKLIKRIQTLNKEYDNKSTQKNIYKNRSKNIIIFAVIDYILRILPNIYYSLYRYDYVITDRYIYDVIVGFSIYSNNSKIFKKILPLFPKPDIIFYVDVPEIIAFNRKEDIPSIEYLSKQIPIYHKLISEYKVKKIDGTKKIDEISSVIKYEINFKKEKN